MEKIIESNAFYDVIETTTTYIKPNFKRMEKEISDWLIANPINGIEYRMHVLTGHTLYIIHTNGMDVDGEFTSEDELYTFLKKIEERYQFKISLPNWYFHK